MVPGGRMNFELTDDQELIRKSVAELASKYDDHYWMENGRRTTERCRRTVEWDIRRSTTFQVTSGRLA